MAGSFLASVSCIASLTLSIIDVQLSNSRFGFSWHSRKRMYLDFLSSARRHPFCRIRWSIRESPNIFSSIYLTAPMRSYPELPKYLQLFDEHHVPRMYSTVQYLSTRPAYDTCDIYVMCMRVLLPRGSGWRLKGLLAPFNRSACFHSFSGIEAITY